MMSLLKVVVLFFFATVAFAQSAFIDYPAEGASVPAGQSLTVQVAQPDSLTGSTEIAIVIGLVSCAPGHCPAPVDSMGTILYDGPYNPQFPQPNFPPSPPYQNFSVAIPASWTKGSAQLNLAHFSLVGVSAYILSETRNVSITIV